MIKNSNPNWDLEQALTLAMQLIEHYEGFRKTAYRDAGKGIWTVGWGRTGPDVRGDSKTTPDKEREWLIERLTSDIDWLHQIFTDLTPHQAAALASFVYNVGRAAFLSYRVYRHLSAAPREMEQARKEWLDTDKVTKPDGKKAVLKGLTYRRTSEWTLYSTGELKLPD